MELTKDAEKMICVIYHDFLSRRKNRIPKSEASRFSDNYFQTQKAFKDWLDEDLDFTLLELAKSGLTKIYIDGNFDLTDSGVYYMENRFKNGLKEVADFISKFIP